jgi:hypothetical protein
MCEHLVLTWQNFSRSLIVSTSKSFDTRVAGTCDANQVEETVTTSPGCFNQSWRHGCSYYNFPCTTNPSCPAGQTKSDPCENASCESLEPIIGESDPQCKLKCKQSTYNVCEYTGDVTPVGQYHCQSQEQRCVLQMKTTYKESGAPTQYVWVVLPGGKQCETDPLYNRANTPKCNP